MPTVCPNCGARSIQRSKVFMHAMSLRGAWAPLSCDKCAERSFVSMDGPNIYWASAVLILGLFSAVSLQKTVRDKLEGLAITSIYYGLCWVAFIVAVLLLCIGLWNATLALSEKGFYGVTFFMTLFGAIAVQKNTRDSAMSSDTESASLFKKVRDQLKAEY